MNPVEYDLLRQRRPDLLLPPLIMLDEPTQDKMKSVSAQALEQARQFEMVKRALNGDPNTYRDLNPRT